MAALPMSVPYTGPSTPFLSSDGQGNVVLSAPVGSTVNFESGVIVGGTQGLPPSTAEVAMEIPLHATLGLAQASSLLVSNTDSQPAFYTTANPTWSGPAAQVFGGF